MPASSVAAAASVEGASRPDPAVVLYDRDCGFCRWSLALVLRWDVRRRLRPVALQDPEADELLAGMDAERRFASAHLVTADGHVYSGGLAARPILDLLPHGTPLARVAALAPGPLRAGYDFVARNRATLGRPLSKAAKDRATARIDRHGAQTTAGA